MPVKRGSVINQAAEEICRLIDGKSLKPGDALPPETTLSEMLGLSRNSIREAVRMLHGLGVIEKQAGRGAIVTSASTSGWGVIDEATLIDAALVANEVRLLTMQQCAVLAAQRLSAQDLVRLAEEFDALESAAAIEDRVAAKRAHDAFYGMILAGSKNALLASMFKQADSARLTTLSWPAHKTFVAARHLDHHRALLRALQRRDGEAAAKAVRLHYLALGRMIKLVTAELPKSQNLPDERRSQGPKRSSR